MLPPIPMISLHPCSPHVIPPLPISYFLIPVQSLFLIYPQCIFCFHLSPSTSLCLSCYLVSLGMWMVEWLSFALQLITTYNWVHYTFVFLGLCYLTQDEFFLVLYIYLQSSWLFLSSRVILYCVNVPLFLYPVICWVVSRLFPISGCYE